MKVEQKYTFKYIEIPKNNTFFFYGDNLLESIELVDLFEKFNKENIELIEYGFNTVSQYVKKYRINNEIYTFVLTSYFHNGKLPSVVRKTLIKNDKPDVIVYSLDEDEVIFGFENTVSTLAGNATWQRTARATSFIKEGKPFAFLSYFSKQDKSAKKSTKPRKASDLFVATYIALSLNYSIPALVGFYEHEDPKQNITLGKQDWREEILKYLFATITKSNNKDEILMKCFKNMRDYYFGDDIQKFVKTEKVFPNKNFEYIKNENFSKNIINDINNKINVPLFNKNLTPWKNKEYKINYDDGTFAYSYNLSDILNNELNEIKFYQLTKDCKAGITFETEKLINFLNAHSSHKGYFEDYIKNKNYPTVILPTKFRKKDYEKNKMVPTQDPYNGEIPAFYELYTQSFGKINFILLVVDHSNKTNYSIKDLQGSKVYRTINNYVDLVIDADYNYLSNQSEKVNIDSKKRYESEFITESDVTCLLKILLSINNIEPSFINPPGGSWSDIKLYPTNKYYYYGRKEKRADIAYYNPKEKTYYVGESKDNYKNLKKTLNEEMEKVDKVIKIIKENIDLNIPFKRFAAFGGTVDEAKSILNESDLDFVIVVEDKENQISVFVVEKEV